MFQFYVCVLEHKLFVIFMYFFVKKIVNKTVYTIMLSKVIMTLAMEVSKIIFQQYADVLIFFTKQVDLVELSLCVLLVKQVLLLGKTTICLFRNIKRKFVNKIR